MRLIRLALVAALGAALLCLACAGVRVRTDYDDAVDFAKLSTFVWIDPPLREEARAEGAPDVDPFTHNTLVDKRVRDEVDAYLVAHGFRAAREGESPDFLLRYELVSREVTRDSPVFVTGGFGRYGYGSAVGYSQSNTYQEGTLILDVIDPSSERIAWRGWGISQSRDAHMDPERLHDAVTAILARFPPKPKAD
jgi:Domain of unknown function (DUF4136)